MYKLSIVLLLLIDFAYAERIELHLMGRRDQQQQYYHRLLQESLQLEGHRVSLVSEPEMPLLRVYKLLESGELSAHWLLQTAERDKRFLRVNVPLSFGLIGQRLLLVKKGRAAAFSKVKTLADLQATNKRAGMAQGWFDVMVWKENQLPVYEQIGDWQILFKLVTAGNRDVDYLPRGAIEALDDLASHPDLEIEPGLLLNYERDFVFYVSPRYPQLRGQIEKALQAALASGLQRRLFDQFLFSKVKGLNLNKRTVINLNSPVNY
ncbi:ABC transporter substrate-binding protein [Iodobacter ciconiae]|uniref:Solute-binding protein family 3/N-terminal domain-containing protein n=1 Tax=Iodobacter ciconiae TaxID=2496266 RepID=A0A3S8ZVD8_9NEIS|nr:ABC transporter substrate-binding protein [Iodobacter ciconiae]AZN37463.1 hypothetical protein EJO50_13805 [Iodobacter ciconiae]